MKKLLFVAALLFAASPAFAGRMALLGAGNAGASCTYVAPAHVQNNSAAGSTATLAVTLTGTVGSGHAIVASVFYPSAQALTSFVDDKGDAIPPVANQNVGGGFIMATFYLSNITNGPKTFTATLSGAPAFAYVTIDEYANVGSFDTFTVPLHLSSATSPNSLTSGLAPALTNNDLIWGVMVGDVVVPTIGTGFTARVNDGTNGVLTEDLIQATGAPVAATSQVASSGGAVAMMALKAACPQTVQLYTFYVDSVSGSDSNTGASPAQAYQNITKLPSLTSGQTVGLAAGSYWRQEARNTASNMIFASYGSGARPILDGSDIIPNATLVKTATFTNVYNTPSALTFLDGGNLGWISVFETGGPGDSATGSYLTEVASEALVDSTACSYFISGMVADSALPSSGTIFFHSCDNTSPITNGYTYEFSNRPTGLYMQGFNNTAIGIETRKSADNDGSLQCQTDGGACTFNNVLARLGGKHNAFAPCGSVVENSIFINAFYPLNGNHLVIFDNAGSGKNSTISGNIFQQDQDVGGESAYLSHAGSSSCGAHNLSNNWYIAKNGSSLTGIAVQNASVVNSSSSFGSQLLSYINPQTPISINGDQSVSAATNNTPINITSGGGTLAISNSKFCSSSVMNGIIENNGGNGSTINLSNDLFYLNAPIGASTIVASPYSVAMIVNGVDMGTSNSSIFYYNLFATGDTFSGNNNIYEAVTSPTWQLNNTPKTTLAAWQAFVTPQDAASSQSGGNAVSACSLPTTPVVNFLLKRDIDPASNDNDPMWLAKAA